MKITSYNHHAKAPSFPRSLSPQTKTTRSIEPSLFSNQPLAFFATAGSDAADATFVRSAQTPLRMLSWYPSFAKNAKD
jgi:hypothetical protein